MFSFYSILLFIFYFFKEKSTVEDSHKEVICVLSREWFLSVPRTLSILIFISSSHFCHSIDGRLFLFLSRLGVSCCWIFMCISVFLHQREQLKRLLSAKEEEGARAMETVRVQQRSHLVSKNISNMLIKGCCSLTPDPAVHDQSLMKWWINLHVFILQGDYPGQSVIKGDFVF